MRSFHGLILPALLLAYGCAPQPQSLSEADLAAIQTRFDEIERHVAAEDNAAWSNDFTPDGVFMGANMPAIRGRAAIQQWGETNGRAISLEFSEIEVHGSGDVAYATGVYTLTAEGSAAPDVGKFLVAMQRQPDGSWLHTVASVSSDTPLPAAATL
jgi:ketosteroid isomerase-like protein